jgi:hypothetical protein
VSAPAPGAADAGAQRNETAAPPKAGTISREDSKRRRREREKAASRLRSLEEEIARFEARARELATELAKDPGGDWERVNRLANEEQDLRARLERRYAEWERLTEHGEGSGGG